ncbi:hypothetical protein V6N13_029561 [Hibiscus sabdariffa]
MYTTALQGSHGIATTIYLNNSISSWIQGDGITSGRMIFKLGVRFKIRIKWITNFMFDETKRFTIQRSLLTQGDDLARIGSYITCLNGYSLTMFLHQRMIAQKAPIYRQPQLNHDLHPWQPYRNAQPHQCRYKPFSQHYIP